METNLPEKDFSNQNAPASADPDNGEAWTESEWFQEWLRLARAPHAPELHFGGELHDEAA